MGSKPSSADAVPSAGVNSLTVVGIGASAGGLDALKSFFARVPADSGVAWVVVVHLSPTHESRLAELLQVHARIPVRQAAQTTPLEADHIYVIPPNANLNAVDSHLRLSDVQESAGRRMPIDHFFRTLARTYEGHSVGVILTGTGSDGTQGIREIRASGGLTLAQDPEEAEYGDMPRNAIATGDVDAIFPVAELPETVLRLSRTKPRVPWAVEGPDGESGDRSLIEKIVALVRARTGRDFSHYKRPTVMRRIARRMQLRHVEELAGYLELLGEERTETEALADDILITVTSFFRDPQVFDALAQNVIPQLFANKGPADCVRVWSVGCATGEEAYSLTMLLLEEAERHRAPPSIQVFATDLHGPSLIRARDGVYSGEIEADVSPERLERFFQKLGNGRYKIRKEVRELVLFSRHDLLSDPPFARLDLIACRNVLIYLLEQAQRDVFKLFHYCLGPDGLLMLGAPETTDVSRLFEVKDKEHRIFRRRTVTPESRVVFPLAAPSQPETVAPEERRRLVMTGELHQRMVEWYAPPSILVAPDDTVVHLSENVGRYLIHGGGEPTINVFKVVPERLRVELRLVLHAARRSKGEMLQSRPVRLKLDGHTAVVVLRARQSVVPGDEGYALVMFDEQGAPEDQATQDAHPKVSPVVAPELAVAEHRLQAIIADYEVTQEQFRAANEELQSSNQELRATMEELETSKEELQSINEELQAVNEENRHRVEELAQLSSDLQNLLVATDIATLFLDRQLRILRFTPKLAELFNIRPSDHGRTISDLTHRLGYPELLDDCKSILSSLVPIEGQVRDENGRWYLKRLLPYRTTDNRIEGVVITFVDISDRKQMEDELRVAKELADNIIETMREPLLVLEPDLRIRMANPEFYAHFAMKREDTIGKYVYDIGNGQWDIPELRKLLGKILPELRTLENFEVDQVAEDGKRRILLINARQLTHARYVLLGIHDITDFRHREDELRAAKELAEQASRLKSQFLSTMSHELRTPLNAVISLTSVLETNVAGPTSPEQRDYLARIRKAAWHLVKVIDDILTFARSEAGRERVEVSETDVAEIARDVVAMLEIPVATAGRELHLEGAERAVYTITDAHKVRQVLTNLVGNAVKHGKGRVDVDLKASGEWLKFRVSDHGPGIPSEQLESIFEPFVQISLSSAAQRSGTGLGLTICRRIAHMLGGNVTVESALGQGSVFTLQLPLEQGNHPGLPAGPE